MADAKIQSAFDCFHVQNQLRASRALRPQRRSEYQRRVLFARFPRKGGRSLEEDVDLMGVARREMRGQLLYPPRYGGRYLLAQFAVDRANRKFRRREFHRFAQNRPGIFATLLEATAAFLFRS